jgi:sugar phosphate isomerase/epimerase
MKKIKIKNKVSITSPPLNYLIKKEYYDLDATLKVMNELYQFGYLDGFEFQRLGEWRSDFPPIDEKDQKVKYRYNAWKKSKKYNQKDLIEILGGLNIPILSIHGERDIGNYLCSKLNDKRKRGLKMVQESLELAERVGADLCVFHIWDTWKKDFNPKSLTNILKNISPKYKNTKITIENMPTHLNGYTPYSLVNLFDWITLDLRWAAMFKELDRFQTIKERILNIHIRGKLVNNRWVLQDAPFTLEDALDKIINGWSYSKYLTIEPEGGVRSSRSEDLIEATINLLRQYSEK